MLLATLSVVALVTVSAVALSRPVTADSHQVLDGAPAEPLVAGGEQAMAHPSRLTTPTYSAVATRAATTGGLAPDELDEHGRAAGAAAGTATASGGDGDKAVLATGNGSYQHARKASRNAVSGAVKADKPSVVVVGDSLTVELAGMLKERFSKLGWKLLWVDARVGRGVGEGLDILRERRLGSVIVVALGTNDYLAGDATVEYWVDQVSSIAGKQRQVAWINLHMNPDVRGEYANYKRINRHLKETARDTQNVRVFDWASFAKRNGIRLGSDGVHYPYDTFPARAKFYVAAAARLWSLG